MMFLRKLICGIAFIGVSFVGTVCADEAPKPSVPVKEHQLLKQFVGEWDLDIKGTSNARMLGELWLVAEMKMGPTNMPITAMLTIGYDPKSKKYIGTWIDSMTNFLWKYEGSFDAAGKVLTMEAEGPNPLNPGKMSKYKDVYEFKDKDHQVLTSFMQSENGTWNKFSTASFRRK
jgi:hypothetical protein